MIYGSNQLNNKSGKIDFELMKKCNLKSIDFQDFVHLNSPLYKLPENDFISFCESLKNECSMNGITINQLHALWEWPVLELNETDDESDKYIFYFDRACKGARLLGCKYVVMHPRIQYGFTNDVVTNKKGYKSTIAFVKKLIPIAKENDVIICLENMPFGTDYTNTKNIINMVDEINSPFVGMCLDTGHCNVTKEDLFLGICLAGDHLKCLHVHDNYGEDSHNMPRDGQIDWNKFVKGLKSINYSGVISFETVPKTSDTVEFIDQFSKTINYFEELLK